MWILPHLPLCSITNIPSFSSSSCQFPVEFGRISIKSVFPCVNIPSKFAAFHKTAPVLLTPDFKKILLLLFQSPFPPPRFANISLSRPQQTASHRAQPKPPCGRFSAACGRCGGAAAPPGLRPKAPSPPAPNQSPPPPGMDKPPPALPAQPCNRPFGLLLEIHLFHPVSPFHFPYYATPAAKRKEGAPQQTASHRAQPKPPCGRFSAACGRCGGAAAPPGLRSKATLTPCAQPKLPPPRPLRPQSRKKTPARPHTGARPASSAASG